MNRQARYCPNCVEEMVAVKERLGKETRFYVCKRCGVRESQDTEQDTSIIKINNDEANKEQGYYDCSEDNIMYHYIQQKDTVKGTRDK